MVGRCARNERIQASVSLRLVGVENYRPRGLPVGRHSADIGPQRGSRIASLGSPGSPFITILTIGVWVSSQDRPALSGPNYPRRIAMCIGKRLTDGVPR